MAPASQGNNFGLARLVLASAVVLLHIATLSGLTGLSWLVTVIAGLSPVPSFFAISGFLVAMSYDRAASLPSFAAKRFLRIYPALFAVVTATALMMPASEPDRMGYLAANLISLDFLHPVLGASLSDNPDPAANGALWSIKVELMFYASLPGIMLAVRRYGAAVILGGLYMASIVYRIAVAAQHDATGDTIYLFLGAQLPGQICYFVCGMATYLYQDAFSRHRVALLTLAVPVFALGFVWQAPILYPASLAIVILSLCVARPISVVGNRSDYSYGLYLVHYPIIQGLVAAGLAASNPALFVAASIALSALAAFLIWHLIEKPILHRKPKPARAAIPA